MKRLFKMKSSIQLSAMRGLFLLVALFILGTSCQQKASTQKHTSQTETAPDSLISAPTSTDKTLKIAYIGNMGVLLESDTQTVIIDGLHEFYKADYVHPAPATVEALISGQYPGFSALEAAMVTHHHGDHYSPSYVKRFLTQNPTARLLGAAQVVNGLKQLNDYNTTLNQQLTEVDYNQGILAIEQAGISIKATRCPHVNPARHSSIQNVAYLVNLNGYNILHVGDTNWGQAENTFQALELNKLKLDVAVLPYWMLLDETAGQQLAAWVNPHHIIATHIPPNFSKEEQEELSKNYPAITLFMELGEVLNIN